MLSMFVYIAMTIGEKDFLGCVITLEYGVIVNLQVFLENQMINSA